MDDGRSGVCCYLSLAHELDAFNLASTPSLDGAASSVLPCHDLSHLVDATVRYYTVR